VLFRSSARGAKLPAHVPDSVTGFSRLLTTACASGAIVAGKGCDVRGIQTLAGIAVLIAVAVYWDFGTLSPCGMLRENVRQRDALAAVLPDSVVDLTLAGQYGALSPGRCFTILMNNLSTSIPNTAQVTRQPAIPQATPAPAPVTAQDPLKWAAKVTEQAANECRAKRLRGELPTYAASAQCSNASMLAAFNEAGYRYMDLIQFFASKRLELGAKVDRGELTEQQAQLDGNKIYAGIQETERRRDSGAR
jgi:hypothetical protein